MWDQIWVIISLSSLVNSFLLGSHFFLHYHWLSVYCFPTFTAKIVLNYVLLILLSLLPIFAEVSTFQNVDLHLEFSTLNVGWMKRSVPNIVCWPRGIKICQKHTGTSMSLGMFNVAYSEMQALNYNLQRFDKVVMVSAYGMCYTRYSGTCVLRPHM